MTFAYLAQWCCLIASTCSSCISAVGINHWLHRQALQVISIKCVQLPAGAGCWSGKIVCFGSRGVSSSLTLALGQRLLPDEPAVNWSQISQLCHSGRGFKGTELTARRIAITCNIAYRNRCALATLAGLLTSVLRAQWTLCPWPIF